MKSIKAIIEDPKHADLIKFLKKAVITIEAIADDGKTYSIKKKRVWRINGVCILNTRSGDHLGTNNKFIEIQDELRDQVFEKLKKKIGAFEPENIYFEHKIKIHGLDGVELSDLEEAFENFESDLQDFLAYVNKTDVYRHGEFWHITNKLENIPFTKLFADLHKDTKLLFPNEQSRVQCKKLMEQVEKGQYQEKTFETL